MKKKYLIMLAFLFLINVVACSNNEGSRSDEDKELGTVDSMTYTDMFSLGLTGELGMNWDEIHLSKEQFQEFLQSLTAVYEEGQHFVEAELLGAHKIQLIFNNEDEQSFENIFMVQFVDNLVRRFYMHSDYGDSQPTIIFKNLLGDVIAENSDFIPIEEEETQTEVEISTMN